MTNRTKPTGTGPDHTRMTLAEAITWARKNSHPDARARLRSRSAAYILLMALQESQLREAELRSRLRTLTAQETLNDAGI